MSDREQRAPVTVLFVPETKKEGQRKDFPTAECKARADHFNAES